MPTDCTANCLLSSLLVWGRAFKCPALLQRICWGCGLEIVEILTAEGGSPCRTLANLRHMIVSAIVLSVGGKRLRGGALVWMESEAKSDRAKGPRRKGKVVPKATPALEAPRRRRAAAKGISALEVLIYGDAA
jgi:hypothetical protein